MIDDPRLLAARLIAGPPLAMTIADVRAQTQERRRKLLAAPPVPEHEIAPEPLPVLDALADYARDFWKDTPPNAKPASRRKKAEPLQRKRSPLRVIDGGKSGDKRK